ncbi:MAG: VWA domain-containing protein [Candidatus Omnitrophica bacterium]|nr:VWA domain-containing protein [Candidatus Omnitrophota bacterium]MBU1926102.1 VWA domain-containing protein [Candidatus Omnitrophota bacterium]
MVFKDFWVLILLLLIAPYLIFFKKKDRTAAINFSSRSFIGNLKSGLRIKLYKNLIFLRALVLIFFILALARPQVPLAPQRISKKGIDMVLALDTSTSMEALDFQIDNKRQNRLYAVKQVVDDFIASRSNDRIGMIAFAGRPYIVCPLTFDHSWLTGNLERVQIGMVEDGTAIGSAIAAALNRLKNSAAKTKIIILLTDGRNNAGKISPQTAAEAAKALKVKVYTIGAGSVGPVPYPVKDLFGNTAYQNVEIDLDEELLKEIAQVTGGRYFRATDTATLKKIYEQIDKLEKTPFKQAAFSSYKENFEIFLLWGLGILLFEQLLVNTILLGIP